MSYSGPWRNRGGWGRYEQFCRPDELKSWGAKLFSLIEKYGEAFNDDWWFYYNKKRTVIVRVPIWQRQKRIDQENPKRHFQRKLKEFQ